jgi:hypothetical protein
MKLPANTAPVMRENQTHDVRPLRLNQFPSTKHAATRQAKPMPPL